MTDDTRNAIGDWTEHPPTFTPLARTPLADRDPHDYANGYLRDRLIQKRREAGLPDYPPTNDGTSEHE